MKHRFLALAAMAAVGGAAHAESSVTLSGVIDVGAYQKELAGEASTKNIWSGGMTTSNWAVRASHDLGGGMRALADLSSFFRADVGASGRNDTDAFWSRSSWVGLQSSLGTVRFGRQGTLGMTNLMRFSPFFDSTTFGPSFLHVYMASATQSMATGNGATDSGWSNVASYTSPTIDGFTGSLHLAPSEGGAAGRRAALGLHYAGTALAFGVTADKYEKMSLNFSKPPTSILMTDGDSVNAGVSYDLSAVKLFGQYIRTHVHNATTEITWSTKQLGASAPLGGGRVLAAYAQTDKTQTAAPDQKRQTLSVGYDFDLSKSADVYADAIQDKVTGLRTGTGLGVGVRYRF